MRFVCCGLLYSTQDPDTYQYIDTFVMKTPTLNIIAGKKVEKEFVYSLCCKKNGCFKVEIHRYSKENDKLNLLATRTLKGESAMRFMEQTKALRIKVPQKDPSVNIAYSKKVPWVYGKTIDAETQVARYIDESGDRFVFVDNEWKKEVFEQKIENLTHTN